jgi:hypothetical protein
MAVEIVDRTDNFRFLCLDGDTGSVHCKIWGIDRSGTIPRISTLSRVWNCATRSYLRMRRLIAVRTSKNNKIKMSKMLGPLDYYGDLESPINKNHSFTIQLLFKPTLSCQVYRWPTINNNIIKPQKPPSLKPIPIAWSTTFDATWESDPLKIDIETEIEIEKEIEKEDLKSIKPTTPNGGESLFSSCGFLWFKQSHLVLPALPISISDSDVANRYDWSAYKCKLVKNDIPFSWPADDSYDGPSDDPRLVRYHYQSNYAKGQLEHGGLFLERHPFAQSITPMTQECKGFVILGRWVSNEQKQIQLVALKIPYGYTLVISPFAIHGDATLVGDFLMAMTSNHIKMEKADTVFLKYATSVKHSKLSVKNVSVSINDDSKTMETKTKINSTTHNNNNTHKHCNHKQNHKQKQLIFQPFSRLFWKSLFNKF